MNPLKERIEGFCFHSQQDLLLSKRTMVNGEEIYTKWIPTSQWDWNINPTDRQIMANEIVLETDLDKATNQSLTERMLKVLDALKISYWVYFTGNKSYHIHLIIHGLEKIDDGKKRQKIKELIVRNLFDKDCVDNIDYNNFYPKKLIRLEGSYNDKAKHKVELVTKKEYDNQQATSEKLLEQILIHYEKLQTEIIKKETDEYLTQIKQSNTKIYCMLMQDALVKEFPQGGRHMTLCPNAVAILNDEELLQLSKVQKMPITEFEGWKKKKPQFNCVQFRRYGSTIGKKDICMTCIKNSFNIYNY
jgi:hypothetical protein